MVESKSADTSINFKGHSELSCSVPSLRTLGNFPRSECLGVPVLIFERDDGLFEILPSGCGPFPTRAFAESVAVAGSGWRRDPD